MAKSKKRSLRRVRKSRSRTRKSMNRYYGGEDPHNSDEEIKFRKKIEVFLRLINTRFYNKNTAITDLIDIRVSFSNILYRDRNITDEYRDRIANIYTDFTENNIYKTFTRKNNNAINIAMEERNSELGMF